MGVYIKGMKMPKNCEECILDHKFFKWLGCYKHVSGDTIADGKRSPACPLIELPTHGRLIDADAFEKQNAYFWNRDFINPKYSDTLADLVNDAPTIIEAEEVET